MQYTVMLTKPPDAPWRAIVPALPNYVAEAATREEALAQIKTRLAEAQQYVEYVQIEVPNESLGNGTAPETWPGFGAFPNDPNWGAFFEDLDRQRQ